VLYSTVAEIEISPADLRKAKLATPCLRDGLPEQVCEGSVVLVFETGHSRRNFCGRQLHNHTALDRLCGSQSCQLASLLVPLDFFRGGKLSINVRL
jgi:hypothetical protein